MIVLATTLSFVATFTSELTKPVRNFMKKSKDEENAVLHELRQLRAQRAYDSSEVMSRISSLEEKYAYLKKQSLKETVRVDYVFGYGMQAIVSVILTVFCFLYRNEPVIVFDKTFNLSPLGSVISFPTGIDGAISVPFWVFVSSFTFRSISTIWR